LPNIKFCVLPHGGWLQANCDCQFWQIYTSPRNYHASSGEFSDLDAILLKIPVVAPIYEDWFRVETYYRVDTRNLYRQLLPQFIKELAEETCAAKGVKLESQVNAKGEIEWMQNRRYRMGSSSGGFSSKDSLKILLPSSPF
jgi:hypothetical protein